MSIVAKGYDYTCDICGVTEHADMDINRPDGWLITERKHHLLCAECVEELGLPLVRIVVCQECGRRFHQTDRRQRFCPSDPAMPPGTDSLCARRSRAKRVATAANPEETTEVA